MKLLSNYRGYYRTFGLRGIALAAQEKIVNGPREFMIVPSVAELPVTLRLNTSDIPTYKQIFLDQEYGFDLGSVPNVIIDAGANIGLSSIYFSIKYPNAKIIAIEPEKSNFNLLEKNVKHYPNIVPLRAALWSDNSMVEIDDPGLDKWGFQTKKCEGDVSSGDKEMVPSVTVDRIINEYELTKIDLLKIDIEGAEKEVFESSAEWIDKVGTLVVELHDRLKVGCSRSFYNATNKFDIERYQGELVFMDRSEK